MTKFLAVFCVVLFCAGPALAGSGAKGEAISVAGTASRGFKGHISLPMAQSAAQAEARLAALRSAMPSLAGNEIIRFFLGSEVMPLAPRPDPVVLAWLLLADEEFESRISGVPPDVKVYTTAKLSLHEINMSLAGLLARTDILDIYRRAIEEQRRALNEYDAVAAQFLKPGLPAAAEDDAMTVALKELGVAYDEFEAASAYLALLPKLYSPEDGLPAGDLREYLNLLEGLRAKSPHNYLFIAECARLQLLNGHIAVAKKMNDELIAMQPDYALAYARRAECLLGLELPALALADFDKAIRLEPYHSGFFENRALVHRVLENIPAMCEDLEQSCQLGECSGLEWAKAAGWCRQ